MLKWQYGNYVFAINPNSQGTGLEVVGDNGRFLSGASFSQPSFLLEKYGVNAVFFQNRSHQVSQVSLQNSNFIEYYNGNLYVLNKTDDRVDIYNSNFILSSSISLSSVPNKTYLGFDVQSDGIWVLSDNSTDDTVYKVGLDGSLSSTNSVSRTVISSGIKQLNGYLWILRTNGAIDKVRITDFVKVSTLNLPNDLSYVGLSASTDGNFLIVGNNDIYQKIYHVDYLTGNIINQISFDNMQSMDDVSSNGINFYTLKNQKLSVIKGNTVECDLFLLEKEIDSKKYVDLIDDMGVKKRVSVSDYSRSRRKEFEHMYDVSMSIVKTNRG
jgi:hypothetical protein